MTAHLTPYLETLAEARAKAPPAVSFEFFPPKTAELEEKLWTAIRQLEAVNPAFVSVTYGAGGSTRERTHHVISRMLKETTLKPASHLTCVNATRSEIDEIAKNYWEMGVRHIVALRGDMPGCTGTYVPHPEGYAYADELVKGLKNIADFQISVAAYPEGHPEAKSLQADIDHLKRKIDAGATRAITQYFFDVNLYLDFLEKVRAAGITAPIVPGIVPIHNFKQLVRFSAACGASVPDWLKDLLEPLEDKPELHKLTAAVIAAEQCRLLREAGVEQFHFYTLNHADLTLTACHLLGVNLASSASPAL